MTRFLLCIVASIAASQAVIGRKLRNFTENLATQDAITEAKWNITELTSAGYQRDKDPWDAFWDSDTHSSVTSTAHP